MTDNDMAWRAEISRRLRQAMDEKRMTATELSNQTGINKSSISSYLNRSYKPKQDKIAKLAIALGVSPEWLMALDTQVQLTAPTEDAASLTAEETALVNAYRLASAECKQIISTILHIKQQP